ncbi:MAG: DUF2064 domain-containing protein [Deltaproteobacteria bacterium]|nr:DUF2064 domain-containing protein [Deltaproteobacteria bacterium]
MSSLLILFTRYPVPGKAKTRLISVLGEQGAADLHREMTEHTLAAVQPPGGGVIEIQVRFSGGDMAAMKGWLGESLDYVPQGDGDLGSRMERAFRESFANGCRKVVLIGSDCPELGWGHVEEALILLDDNPIVLGPSTDGGYYLIGIRSEVPERLFDAVFRNISWGTGQVLSETINAVAGTGLDLGLLDDLDDVDEPEDLVHWERAVTATPKTHRELTLSIVIPTFNEEEWIGSLLEGLEAVPEVEVIVSDGGSTDRTLEICRAYQVHVVDSHPGRVAQMNRGAEAAHGDILLFLHADTRLPDGFERLIGEAMSREHVVAGAFRFAVDHRSTAMRIIERLANRRSRLGIVFGDQALFVRAPAFRLAGGFPDQPIMEDYQLMRHLRRQGRVVLLDEAAVTSARKWREKGAFRVTFVNQLVTWLYVLGVGPESLARMYRRLIG